MKLPVGRRLANMYREIYNCNCVLCGHEYDDEIHVFFECPQKLNLNLDNMIIDKIGKNKYDLIKTLKLEQKKELKYDNKNNNVINDNNISEDKLFMILQNKERLYKLG